MSTLITKDSYLWTSSSWPLPIDGPQPITSPSDLDIPIALCKGNRSCTDHLISKFVSYDYLNPTFRQFALSASSEYISRSCEEALLVPAWKQAVDEEMDALVSRETWELVLAPTNVVVVGCWWIYTLKFRPNRLVDWYKARPVAKGYTQTYDIDYLETFSPVARINFIKILFSVAVNLLWPFFQLNVKNAFLYGDLQRRCICLQVILLRGRIKFVVSRRLFMVSSRVYGCGLRSSTLPPLTLIFTDVIQITLSLIS